MLEFIRISPVQKVPRFAWHTPPWDYDTSDGLLAYQPAKSAEGSGEARAIRRAFTGDDVINKGILWLAPEWPGARKFSWGDYVESGFRVDLSKLDASCLRYSYGAEGYIWHLGNIAPFALEVHKNG